MMRAAAAPLVLSAGYASLDRISRVSHLPGPGTTAVVETGDDQLHWGGCAFNIAVGLARLGTRAGVIGVLGDDPAGQSYQGWLEKNGVDTGGVTVRHGPTARSSLYYDKDGTSVCFYWPGPGPMPDMERITEPRGPLGEAGWLLLTVAPAEVTGRLLEECIRRDVPVIWSVKADATVYPEPLVRRLLGQAKILFLNQAELTFLRRFVSTDELFTRGPEIIVLTSGKDGGMAHEKGKSFRYPAAPAREILDATGVGDAFISGFLWKYLEGGGLQEACEAGACRCGGSDRKNGKPDRPVYEGGTAMASGPGSRGPMTVSRREGWYLKCAHGDIAERVILVGDPAAWRSMRACWSPRARSTGIAPWLP